jgi:hypothetical protein
VPVDFYELKKTAAGKQPYAIALAEPAVDGSGEPVGELAFAGRRMGVELRDHHHRTEQAMRGRASGVSAILPDVD